MPICALCLSEVDKLIKSHSIPDFILQESRSRTNGRALLFKKDQEGKLIQYDWKEPMLCANCEAHLSSNYESKLKMVLYQKPSKGKVEVVHSGDDYGVIKSKYAPSVLDALVSILWRASMSNLDIFKHINLDAEISERIRARINPEPDEKVTYEDHVDVFLIKMVVPSIPDHKSGLLITTPYKVSDVEDAEVYIFTLSRYAVLFCTYPQGSGRKQKVKNAKRIRVLRRNTRLIRFLKMPFDHLAASQDLVNAVNREIHNRQKTKLQD